MEWVVEAENLTKVYKDIKAVDNLSLHIREGEIYGLLGPNGAGKTTTILMMLGLTEPTKGYIKVYGYDSTREPLKVKRITSYLPENVGFYEDLTAYENLLYLTRLNGIKDSEADKKIKESLEIVGLSDVAEREVGTYSKGMKQRLGMASVLVKSPKLAILDEPTTGIDPEGVEEMLELIKKMSREQNITILLSSHLLYQVQRICDRVAILYKGKIQAEGTIEEIGKQTFKDTEDILEILLNKEKPEIVEDLKKIEGIKEVKVNGPRLRIVEEKDVREEIIKNIISTGIVPLEIKRQGYSLEEIYLKYFQEG